MQDSEQKERRSSGSRRMLRLLDDSAIEWFVDGSWGVIRCEEINQKDCDDGKSKDRCRKNK